MDVRHASAWLVEQPQPRVVQAQAELDVLVPEEELLVEPADLQVERSLE